MMERAPCIRGCAIDDPWCEETHFCIATWNIRISGVMNPSIERESFSERLQQALRNADYSPDSPTQLAREFNVRFEGRPITVHAARKWLVGEAIPTQEKLRTLAHWLGVPAEWLRFGGTELHAGAGSSAMPARYESADVKLIADLQRLDEHHQVIVREFIRMLVRMSRSK
jgi:transcriptional regulator with XRE-family HTH domain